MEDTLGSAYNDAYVLLPGHDRRLWPPSILLLLERPTGGTSKGKAWSLQTFYHPPVAMLSRGEPSHLVSTARLKTGCSKTQRFCVFLRCFNPSCLLACTQLGDDFCQCLLDNPTVPPTVAHPRRNGHFCASEDTFVGVHQHRPVPAYLAHAALQSLAPRHHRPPLLDDERPDGVF